MPEGNNEREATELILSAWPELNARLERWTRVVLERGGGRGIEKIGGAFTEEYLRELWERTRAAP
jgi:hypothetical protein